MTSAASHPLMIPIRTSDVSASWVVLVNPTSGGGRGARWGRDVVQILQARGQTTRVVIGVDAEDAERRARELLAGLQEGMVDTPHSIFPGTDEQDYYRGLVTEAAPGTERQTAVSKGEGPQEAASTSDAGEPTSEEVVGR